MVCQLAVRKSRKLSAIPALAAMRVLSPNSASSPIMISAIATPTPASHGTEFVVVGKEQGSFGKLRVDADKGKVIVRRVRIYFDDGK